MNYIWGGMLLIGLLFSFANGNPAAFTDGLMSACGDAVQFMIGLAGIMAAWSGIIEIAGRSGLIDRLAERSAPAMRFLFPQEHDPETLSLMLMSFIANIFSAGNSATVFSLKAMERLDISNSHKEYASSSMCMFAAVSMSMIQLVPVSLIQIRQQLGSADPGIIIIPSIAAGLISMLVSILTCKFFEYKELRSKAGEKCHHF